MCWHLNAQRELTDKTSFLVKPVQSFKDEEWLTDMWKNKDFWHPGAPSCVDRCEKEDNIKGCVLVLYVLGSTFLKYRDGLMLVFEMRLTWNSMQWFPALKTVYILRFFIFSLFCEMTAVILNTFVAGYQVCRWVYLFFLIMMYLLTSEDSMASDVQKGPVWFLVCFWRTRTIYLKSQMIRIPLPGHYRKRDFSWTTWTCWQLNLGLLGWVSYWGACSWTG